MAVSQFLPTAGEVAPYRLLAQDGTLTGDASMTHEQVREALRLMVLTRVFDEKATAMQRQGRFGTFSAVRGQEARDRKSTRLNSSH